MACDFFLRYSAMLAAALARGGNEVALVSRDHDREFGCESGAARRFVATAVGSEPVLHREVPGRVRSVRGWGRALRLRQEIRGLQPDVVHLQESVLNDVRLPLAATARPGRFALTVHDPVRHPGDTPSAWTKQSNRALVRSAGLIFVHGEALREELLELLQPRAPIVVVPHGSGATKIGPIPTSPNVLFFGRLSQYKGVEVLLDAMSAVWQRLPAATLTIAGEGELVGHPALSDERVILRIEHVPDADVPKLVEAASCVALPYIQASQSGVGSLVKPYGRPLVASAVGGLPELLADGSGLLVPPANASRLAEALISVLSDRDLASRLGAAGARTSSSESSWDAVAARTVAAYDEHLLNRL